MSIETLDVKTIRQNKGLTQYEMALLLECDIRSVQRYEYGETKPRRIYAGKLAKIAAGEMDSEIAAIKNKKVEAKNIA